MTTGLFAAIIRPRKRVRMEENNQFVGIQTPEIILDVMGQQCPLPVLRARKRLLNLEPGTLLRVFTTDPVSRIDMPHFCIEAGHELVETRDRGGWIEFLIRRGEAVRDAS